MTMVENGVFNMFELYYAKTFIKTVRLCRQNLLRNFESGIYRAQAATETY